MKKAIKTLLCFCLCLSFFLSGCGQADASVQSGDAMTAETVITDITPEKGITLPDGAVLTRLSPSADNALITPISQEEYIARLANEKKLPYEEAFRLETQSTRNSSQNGTIHYYNFEKTFTYESNNDYKITLTAAFKVWQDGLYKQIEDIADIRGAQNTGRPDIQWIELYSWSDPYQEISAFPAAGVVFSTHGYFQTPSGSSTDAISLISMYSLY